MYAYQISVERKFQSMATICMKGMPLTKLYNYVYIISVTSSYIYSVLKQTISSSSSCLMYSSIDKGKLNTSYSYIEDVNYMCT